jgi:hypothetical protein
MRHVRLAFLLALVVSAVLVGSVALTHTHHTWSPGLYNAQCPLNDWAGHEAGPRLALLTVARWDAPPVPVVAAATAAPADVVATPDSPRAPPRS